MAAHGLALCASLGTRASGSMGRAAGGLALFGVVFLDSSYELVSSKRSFAMQRMLALCAAVALCLFAASPASAQRVRCHPGQVPCVGGCMPQGAVCCSTGKWCAPGHTCSWEGTCLRQGAGGDPRVCHDGRICAPGERCVGNYCRRADFDRACNNGSYCQPGYTCGNDNRCRPR